MRKLSTDRTAACDGIFDQKTGMNRRRKQPRQEDCHKFEEQLRQSMQDNLLVSCLSPQSINEAPSTFQPTQIALTVAACPVVQSAKESDLTNQTDAISQPGHEQLMQQTNMDSPQELQLRLCSPELMDLTLRVVWVAQGLHLRLESSDRRRVERLSVGSLKLKTLLEQLLEHPVILEIGHAPT